MGEISEYFRKYGKLKVELKRIKEGVYIFGRMRINMLISNEKINVRVGGGFMNLNKFITTYEPLELNKLRKGQMFNTLKRPI